MSPLSNEDVRLIRQAYEERQRLLAQAHELRLEALAEKFGVSRSCIQNITSYRRRTDVV